MRYTVEELINDKELRKEVADGGFGFADRDGEFSAVDFENGSMRQNHISVFEELYAIGGDELFEKLIAQGNTCLTKDPNAAKVGVIPVSGAEGYYLKTNASFAAAFSSILSGLAGLEDDDRFSFGTDEEDDPNTFSVCEEFNYSNIPFIDDLCEIAMISDGSCIVKNPDTDELISFLIKSDDGELRIDKFYKIERVTLPDFQERDDMPFAYKYKLDEYGYWGYFNGTLSQITPPMFEEITLTCYNGNFHLLAWISEGDLYKLYTDTLQNFLYDNAIELNTSLSFYVEEALCPTSSSYIDSYADFDGNGVILYVPEKINKRGKVFLNGNGKSFDNYKYMFLNKPDSVHIEVRVFDHTCLLKGTGTDVAIPVRLSDLYAKDCYHLYFGEKTDCTASCNLYKNYYAVCKDGYMAIAEYKSGGEDYGVGMVFARLLTPFAFTGIESCDDYCIVDRFGKKGVFSFYARSYVVPCEYESIRKTDENTFVVRKGGFTGTVFVDGTPIRWIEKLHRED